MPKLLEYCLLTALAVHLSCLSAQALDAKAKKGVESALGLQIAAWNRGDIDGFMEGYLKSPDMSYTSGGTEVWGYEALRKRYQERYGTSRDTMGQLSFSNLRVADLGARNALCIGNWRVTRSNDPELKGTFSLVYVKDGGKWKVLHDHTSTLEDKDKKETFLNPTEKK